MIGRKTNNFKKGFTLIETVISIALFSLVSISIVVLFVSAASAQKKVLDMQNVQNSARILLETFSREARMAIIDSKGTCVNAGAVFQNGAAFVKFKNSKEECVKYWLDNGMIKKTAIDKLGNASTTIITESNTQVSSLSFYLRQNLSGIGNPYQPFMVLKATIKKAGSSDDSRIINLQTSISARAYE